MIAVISDVHGNYPALKSVIQDIHKYGCERIISLGDIVGYYCMVNECIDLCRKENVVNILGNHDYYLISGDGCPRSYSVNICIRYQTSVITKQNIEWLKNSEKRKRSGNIDEKKKKYINKRFTDFWNVCMYVDRLQWKKRERGGSHRN